MNIPQFGVTYFRDGQLTPEGIVFQQMAEAIAALQDLADDYETRIAALETTIADHETRIAALEGP